MSLEPGASLTDGQRVERRSRPSRRFPLIAALICGALVVAAVPACGGGDEGRDEVQDDAAEPEAAADAEETSDEASDAGGQAPGGAEMTAADCPVDRAAVEAAYGIEFKDPEVEGDASGYSCTFIRGDEVGSAVFMVMNDGRSGYLGQAATMPDAEPVSSVGQEAIFSPGFTKLVALVNGKVLILQIVSMVGVDDVRGKTTTLARDVASRI